LQESVWHPQQHISAPEKHGHVIWEAPIAEWQEMLPWIRGWGADVEVLGPGELKEILINEAKKLAEQYGWKVGWEGGSNLRHRGTARDRFLSGLGQKEDKPSG
jgi:CRISPR-associated endonuclease/helicase Cas3